MDARLESRYLSSNCTTRNLSADLIIKIENVFEDIDIFFGCQIIRPTC
jgi:hypothetical protein